MKHRAIFGLVLWCAAMGAQGTSLLLRPTTVVLSGKESAATITLTNSGEQPVTAQLRLYSWDQKNNDDLLTETTQVVASPPMVNIPPGKSQTVRVVRVGATPASAQESYRVIVDEIVDRSQLHADAGVVMQLRYSVPVFVMPKPGAKADATVNASVSGDTLTFGVANRGAAHAQISKITVAYSDGSSNTLNAGLVGYVLPDRQRQWVLKVPAGKNAGSAARQVRAVINGKELAVAL
jgi:fimbrial chaperone protein